MENNMHAPDAVDPLSAPKSPKKPTSALKISGLDTLMIIGMIPQLAMLYPEVQLELKSLDSNENGEALKALIPKTLEAVETLKGIYKLATT